nr:MAG TPA: hypothetical protein [Caudoviricetes sp.]
MAGSSFTINFDTGIEKVEYGTSQDNFPQGEANSSGQTVTQSTFEFYVRPIFKQGYELDTTNVSQTANPGIYVCTNEGGKPVYNVTFTSKQSTSSPTFKHFFNSGTIGTGTIKFRHFSQTEPLPQLATPQNVAVEGTTLSWDAVENATSYDIYADGTLIGNTDGGSIGGTVTFNVSESSVYARDYFRIYDGTDTSGALLYEVTGSSPTIPSPLTVNCSTGNLFVSVHGHGDSYCEGSNATGGVTITNAGYQDLTLTVTSNGTIDVYVEYDS